MKTQLIMVWANIKSKKLQSFALGVVFIAVSILFFLSISLFGTTGEYENFFTESKASQSLIYVNGDDTKDVIVDFLENHENVANVSTLANFDQVIESSIEVEGDLVKLPDVFLTEYATGEYDQLRIIDGKQASELQDNEVIFSYGKSTLFNIEVGDILTIITPTGTKELTIAGIGIDLTYNFDTITLNRFWTTKANIDSLENGEENYSIGISYVDYSAESEQQMFDDLDILLEDSGSGKLVLQFSLILEANSFFQIVIGAIFTLIGVILITVGLFIVRSIIYNNIITESKKIATLKSSGFSSKNIITMYSLEYGLIAVVSIFIGMMLSFIFSNIVLSDINELSGFFDIATKINYSQMIIVFIIILLIIELSVCLVAKRVTKINPAVALSRGIQTNEDKTYFPISKHKRMPFSLVLAMKDILSNMKMIVTILLFIVATSFTIVTLSSAAYSFNSQKENNLLWLGYDIDAKVVSSDPLDLDAYEDVLMQLNDSDYVQGTVSVYQDLKSQIYDENQGKYITSISQIFITDSEQEIEFSVLDGRIPENEGEVMLASNLLETLEKSLGDYVTVKSLDETLELLVVGECQSLTNQGMTFSIFHDNLSADLISQYLLQINFVDDVEEDILVNEIDDIFESNISLVFEEGNASMLSMFDILSVVVGGIISIFSIISLIVLLNLNITNVNKERFNYGIYKSMGMSDQMITNIYLIKNSIINIIGIIIGGLLAVLVIPAIMNAMTKQLGISEFPTSIDYNSIFVALGIIFAVTLINALFIKRNISTITPKELLVE